MKDFKKILSFKGDKKEIHRQLKIWCAYNDTDVNTKVIDIIEDFLKKNKLDTNIRDWKKKQ